MVGDCYVRTGVLYATVLVRNLGPGTHSYQAEVVWGPTDNPFGTVVATVANVAVNQTGRTAATTPVGRGAPDAGSVPCAILSVKDESGQQPTLGPPLPPPPNTQTFTTPPAVPPTTIEPPSVTVPPPVIPSPPEITPPTEPSTTTPIPVPT